MKSETSFRVFFLKQHRKNSLKNIFFPSESVFLDFSFWPQGHRSTQNAYCALLSGSWILSAEKSRTLKLLLSNTTFLTRFEIFLIYVHIAVPLKEKDDSLQTFIEHVQYTNNMKNIIFHLSTTHQTSFSFDCVTIACINFMKHLIYVIIDKKII